MEAKELMIGDWVMVHNKPQRVAIVEETCIFYWAELLMSCELLSPSLADIHPIPLTEEILKANGLIKDKEYGYFGEVYGVFHRYYGQQGFQIISGLINPYKEFELKLPEPIHYVHELQHALCLCGLAELADNFKI